MNPKEAFSLLKNLSLHLQDVEYYEILSLMRVIGRLPIPIARVPVGVPIDRVRKNIGDNLFTTVDDISYITDPAVIRDHLTEYGRANKPHTVMFYGAVESSLIRHQRITAIAETSALYQDEAANNIAGELYTVSRWITEKELFVAEMVFATEALNINPDTKRAYLKQTQYLSAEASEHELDFQLEVIRFIIAESIAGRHRCP